MDLYAVLTSDYLFDDEEGVLYRKTKTGKVKLNPTGNSKQVGVRGKKYKLAELVYLLANPSYKVGTGRVLAYSYDNPTTSTVILKDAKITLATYKKYFYYDTTKKVFLRKFSLKGANKAGTALRETRNAAGSLILTLDTDVEVVKATLVWHWYTGDYVKGTTTRFIFIDGNPDNTHMDNLVLNTVASFRHESVSSIRLAYMFTYNKDRGTIVPNYPAKVFVTENYGVVSLAKHTVGIHRILYALYHEEPLKAKNPVFEIDHIDHNRQNNTYSNLRKVVPYLNTRNRSMNSNNTSGYNGVRKFGERYRVDIASNYLGLFETLEAALKARDIYTAANKYHNNHGLII